VILSPFFHLILARLDELSTSSVNVRKKKPKAGEDGQFSLDAFSTTPLVDEEASIPEMMDLDLMEAAERELERKNEPATEDPSTDVKSLQMPSIISRPTEQRPRTHIEYHDLGELYPYAPVPLLPGKLVLHYATLHDFTGTEQLMNWAADGHATIVDMRQIMKRQTEFSTSVALLHEFIELDLKGQIIKLNQDRILILPSGVRGVDGLEMEAFAVDPDDLTEV
jgi:SepF-like predicted cell division protein (DUF552 family)